MNEQIYTQEISAIDPELIQHLRNNLNQRIWINKDGTEIAIKYIPRKERVIIYNLIVTNKLNTIPFIQEWKPIILASLQTILP